MASESVQPKSVSPVAEQCTNGKHHANVLLGF